MRATYYKFLGSITNYFSGNNCNIYETSFLYKVEFYDTGEFRSQNSIYQDAILILYQKKDIDIKDVFVISGKPYSPTHINDKYIILRKIQTDLFLDEGIVMKPMLTVGQSVDSVKMFDLVHQAGETIILADKNTADYAVGVVIDIKGDDIYHTRNYVIESVPVAGTITSSQKLYLGDAGGLTFTVPSGGDITQKVGFANKTIGDGYYGVTISIDNY